MYFSGVRIRPPQSIPQHANGIDYISLDDRHTVTIKHPGYDDGRNNLLVLPALDHKHGGLDHETALVACGIISGNRWDGFFTSERDGESLGKQPIILPVGSYFYHPDAASTAVAIRDRNRCRVSAHSEVCEMAHLCPASENEWFHSNEMFRYNHIRSQTGSSAIKDINNLILLRSDLHTSFDRRKFVIVPKRKKSSGEPRLVSHMLEYSTELATLYHNVAVGSVAPIHPAFLLARLAWSLFPFIEGFLQGNTERALLLNGKLQQSANIEECRSYTKQAAARSRSNSPKKRAREDDIQDREGNTGYALTTSLPPAKQIRLSSNTVEQVPDHSQSANGALTALSTLDQIHEPLRRIPSASSTTAGYSITAPATLSTRGSSPAPPKPNPIHVSLPSPPTLRSSQHLQSYYSNPLQTRPFPSQNIEYQDDRIYIENLKNHNLEAERQRSDAAGHWQKELEWAQATTDNGPLDSETLEKVFEILGG